MKDASDQTLDTAAYQCGYLGPKLPHCRPRTVYGVSTMIQITPTGQSFTIIHFVFQENPERVACMPNMTEFHETMYHKNILRSNDPRAVSCPACKRTDAYKNHPDTNRK